MFRFKFVGYKAASYTHAHATHNQKISSVEIHLATAHCLTFFFARGRKKKSQTCSCSQLILQGCLRKPQGATHHTQQNQPSQQRSLGACSAVTLTRFQGQGSTNTSKQDQSDLRSESVAEVTEAPITEAGDHPAFRSKSSVKRHQTNTALGARRSRQATSRLSCQPCNSQAKQAFKATLQRAWPEIQATM